ncbi:hypothetical protein PGT21_000691 [Puccinia graminis f. sp. tritici]|uniref:Uncharacterized protein n=1 Tax=Puccinia graminis f. sp. tritici TaxID=56615 RepID=A0A5B0PMU7_PUCGR|nr:hypothetical protein PGT21_000691 [Puccinia graminis f. sp. tritici]
MKELQVSSSDLRMIGQLQEFSPNLEAESELSEGLQIRESWEKLALHLQLVTFYSQLLVSKGIWQTNILWNEYKAFLRPMGFGGLTVNAVVNTYASVLDEFLTVSNQLSDTIQLTAQTLNYVQALILKAQKRLLIETKQQGFLQRCLNLLLGNGWFMRWQAELTTCERASSIIKSISPFVSDMKGSISTSNNGTEGDTQRLRLLILISSLFQCRP